MQAGDKNVLEMLLIRSTLQNNAYLKTIIQSEISRVFASLIGPIKPARGR